MREASDASPACGGCRRALDADGRAPPGSCCPHPTPTAPVAMELAAIARAVGMLDMRRISSPLWKWLAPAVATTIGVTSTEQTARALIDRHAADPGLFAETGFLFVGIPAIWSLWRSPAGLWQSLNIVPWWITAILAALRVQSSVWVGRSVFYSPNPGFAKMVVNLNAVWATALSPLLFGSVLSYANLGGVALSGLGTFLCAQRTVSVAKVTRRYKYPIDKLMEWLLPGLFASGALTVVEMGARVLATRYRAGAGAFMQSQLAICAMISFGRLLVFEGGLPTAIGASMYDTRIKGGDMQWRTARSQWSENNWWDEPWRQKAWSQVPWYLSLLLAIWRMKWLVWMAQSIQFAPNPGIAKMVMSGSDTVLATIAGVAFFGSRLTPQNLAGVLMSVAGTYLCTLRGGPVDLYIAH